jgi:hypothetical protein
MTSGKESHINIEIKEITQSLAGFHGHMKHADAYSLRRKALAKFVLSKGAI